MSSNRKAAIVTGGAKRIGKEIVFYLARQGYDIALHYHQSKTDANSVAKEIEKLGVACALFSYDLSDPATPKDLILEVFETFPDSSLLVNNASIFNRAYFLETDETFFDDHFTVNVKTPFFLSQHFAKQCKAGHIINLLDTKISKNHTPYFAYSLTKKVLFEFTKMAAKELAPSIRVNGICPGLILPSLESGKEGFDKMAQSIPAKRVGNPECITTALDYLLKNHFVTGECLFVDGGEHLL